MRVTALVFPLLMLGFFSCGHRQQAAADTNPDAGSKDAQLLFAEDFEDDNYEARGWYDNPQIETTAEMAKTGERSCIWHWKQDAILPGGKGGRVKLEPTGSVTLSFRIKHSDNWQWTGRGYHPHEFLFMTTEDPPTLGPATSHLTLYVEVIDGKPVMGMQDSRNIDTLRLGQDLTAITENRAVAGANGDPDGHGGGYYMAGTVHRNGRFLRPDREYFTSRPGPYYQGDWHHVKARFALNSIADGKGVADGIIQYWLDGELIMDYHDVMFRTGAHPDMLINQFQMLPYIGPGAKADQSIWVDDIRITR
ncbi:MAG: hypothetical protein FVQ81_15120 [Candidatus Glassbacteria bacterium]|nr:hypothetical protein [Candidatus Glassbacteria bacterium]